MPCPYGPRTWTTRDSAAPVTAPRVVNGAAGLKGYCHAEPIIIDRFGGKQVASMYPFSQKRDEGMKKFMRMQWGTSLGRRLS